MSGGDFAGKVFRAFIPGLNATTKTAAEAKSFGIRLTHFTSSRNIPM